MPQYISQFYDILAGFIKDGGKQMPQVVGKYFGWSHVRVFTKAFQFCPDLSAGQFFSAFGAKDRAGGGFLFLGVLEQFAAQLGREENDPNFALQGDLRLAFPCGLHGDILDLAYPDSGGSDGFYQ